MATASISYTFSVPNTIDPTQVNQNFTDVANFLNTNVVHKDGSVTMTGALSLPSSDPSSDNQAARKAYIDAALPIGMVVQFAGASAPATTSPLWKLCDGTAVSRTTYAGLFGLISTTYGVGDGSTTFNLPDLRGRVPIGVGTGTGLTARALGAKGGSEALASHDHQTMASEVPLYNAASSTLAYVGKANAAAAGWTYQEVTSNGAVRTGTAGTGTAGNMQPFVVVNFLIKVA